MFRTLRYPRWYLYDKNLKLKIENKVIKISKTKETYVIIKKYFKNLLPTLLRLQVAKLKTNFKVHYQTKN